MPHPTFEYGSGHLTSSTAIQIAKNKVKGILTQSTIEKIERSSNYVKNIASGDQPVYGINTGFGPLCTTQISPEETEKLQENLLKSHAVGVGDPIEDIIAKLMMILKVHALSQGFSGVRLSTIKRIIWFIEQDIIPIVPEQGSVGASGDLAPLSHLFLPLIGEGEVMHQGIRYQTKERLDKHEKARLKLGPKEGLGVVNGTQFIAAHAVLVVHKFYNILSHADICGTLMLEGLKGSSSPFIKDLHDVRPFDGNRYVAERIRTFLKDSEILASHRNCGKVQDPYSLRCMPQVHGSSRNAWLHVKDLVEIEINSVTDNPVIINQDLTISGGNFHGQPLAMAMDYACIAAAELGNISDRRCYLALEGGTDGVPKLLMKNLGTNSGFMIPQYTAAAVVSENKSLSHPASVDSVPTSLGQEDHVSMGSISSRKALQVIENVEKILGIELLSACQAYDYHHPLQSSDAMHQVYLYVRKSIPHISEDVVFYPLIHQAIEIVRSGALINITKPFIQNSERSDQFETY
jgi:histidine ammonia-lyase